MIKLSKRSFEYRSCSNKLFDLKHFIDKAIASGEMASTMNSDYEKIIYVKYKKGLAKIILPIDLF